MTGRQVSKENPANLRRASLSELPHYPPLPQHSVVWLPLLYSGAAVFTAGPPAFITGLV